MGEFTLAARGRVRWGRPRQHATGVGGVCHWLRMRVRGRECIGLGQCTDESPLRRPSYFPSTASITFFAIGAPRRPPEMSEREMSMSVGSMKTATATERPSSFLP